MIRINYQNDVKYHDGPQRKNNNEVLHKIKFNKKSFHSVLKRISTNLTKFSFITVPCYWFIEARALETARHCPTAGRSSAQPSHRPLFRHQTWCPLTLKRLLNRKMFLLFLFNLVNIIFIWNICFKIIRPRTILDTVLHPFL